METLLIKEIVTSLESWRDHSKIGEEIRAMSEAIEEQALTEIEPLYAHLVQIIYHNDDDEKLGRAFRRIYIPLKLLLNDPSTIE
jgi:hypothetical protein